MQHEDESMIFGALADRTRRQIVRELAAQGPLTPTTLGVRAGISRQAAAQHLAVLQAAGLAYGLRRGRETRYGLDTAPFSRAEGWMRSIEDSWARRRAVLERLRAEATRGTEQE
ncbi:MAG: ArsR/SmtB family transcription factor [Solirubrobacterales bacterium]|jgi:DNA-binding transcriptional ArsR family regulator